MLPLRVCENKGKQLKAGEAVAQLAERLGFRESAPRKWGRDFRSLLRDELPPGVDLDELNSMWFIADKPQPTRGIKTILHVFQ